MQIRGTWSAGPGDDQARFLADLRALRDFAAIGYDELAARAHYPSDILKEAENGPRLPGLPILTAYVRACEGNVLDWEERWRRLNPEVADDPDLPVRPAGASPAAVAGARAGVGVAPPDVYDPERIRAALRKDPAHSGQDSRRASSAGISALAHGTAHSESSDRDLRLDSGASLDSGTSWDSGGSWGANSSWDTPADPGIPSANGKHSAAGRGPFDAAFTVLPDPAERTEPAQDQDFSWLNNSRPEARPAAPADRDTARPERADTGLTARERTDFWAEPASSGSTDLQLPAQRAATDAVQGTTAATPSLNSAGSAAQAGSSQRDDRRKDRLFPVRLLAVIVIAALIGSALVLLLK